MDSGDNKMKHTFALIIGAFALAVLPVTASSEVLLKIEGLQGTSVKKGYEGWLVADTLTYSFEPMQTVNRALPNRAGETYTKPSALMTLSDLEISRVIDQDSYKLRTLLASGGVMSNVEIAVFAGSDKSAPVMEYMIARLALERIEAGYGVDGAEETLILRAADATWPGRGSVSTTKLPIIEMQERQ